MWNRQWPGIRLDWYHKDIIWSMCSRDIREVYCKGATGVGKGTGVSLGTLILFRIFDPLQVIVTRDTHERAKAVMLKELRKWWKRMLDPPPGRVLVERIEHHDSHNIVIVNPNSEEGFSGTHEAKVLYIFDEATAAVLNPRFDLADTQAWKFVALANPRTQGGKFRSAFPRNDPDKTQTIATPYGLRRLITVDGADCTNVREKRLKYPVGPLGGITIGKRHYKHGEPIPAEDYDRVKPLIPGQVCYDEYKGHCAKPEWWSRIFAHGQFSKSDPERQVVLFEWCQGCGELWNRWRRARDWCLEQMRFGLIERLAKLSHVAAAGLDVGLSQGGDKNVLTVGNDYGIRQQFTTDAIDDGMDLCDWVCDIFEETLGISLPKSGIPIAIDYGGGFGNAVGDPLKRRRVRVIEVRGNDTPQIDPRVYANRRAELYGEFGKRIDPKGAYRGTRFMMPYDEELFEDLCAPEKVFQGEDRIRFLISPKRKPPHTGEDDAKERVLSVQSKLGRSPDKGDSATLLLEALRHKGSSISQWLEAGAL